MITDESPPPPLPAEDPDEQSVPQKTILPLGILLRWGGWVERAALAEGNSWRNKQGDPPVTVQAVPGLLMRDELHLNPALKNFCFLVRRSCSAPVQGFIRS